jgi:hypothetical protein
MKNHSAFILVTLGLFTMVTIQCSPSRQRVGIASSPDVSQVPVHSDTSTENHSTANNQNSQSRITQHADGSSDHDSSDSSKIENSRILHFSGPDFSIYDTRFDSSFLKSDKHRLLKSKFDSVNHHNTVVGILTPAEVQQLTLNLTKAEVICLSLVNSHLFENFEKEDLEKKFAHYGAKFILVTVSKADSKQRSSFVIQFHKTHLSSGSVERAFKESLKESKQQYGALDFKARLIKKK